MSQQNRTFLPGVEVRVKQDGTSRTIVGWLPYGVPSQGLPFVEMVERGAFATALEPGADVRALRDHLVHQPLARTTAGTLQLRDSAQGLQFTIQLPNVSYANDLVESMERGDIAATCCCSFGFVCIEDAWSETSEGLQRRLLKVDLFEVSILSGDAAYPDSQAALRSVPAQYRERFKHEKRENSEGCSCPCFECSENDSCESCENEACLDDGFDCPNCPWQEDEGRSAPGHLSWSERAALRIEVLKRN